MKSISELFGRIQNRFTKEAAIRLGVQEAIKNSTGIELPLETIAFSATTLVVKGLNSSAQSAVYIKKPQILEAIRAKSIGRNVTDIRFNS